MLLQVDYRNSARTIPINPPNQNNMIKILSGFFFLLLLLTTLLAEGITQDQGKAILEN